MKVKFLLFLVFAASVPIILSSYRLGPASFGAYDCTGAEGTGALRNSGVAVSGCNANNTCHGATTSLNTTVELDSAGVSVPAYHPGGSYTIKISATNSTGISYPVFGFQLAAVLGAHAGDTAAAQAGTWGTTLPAHVQLTPASTSGLNIPIVEHSDTILATTGTGGNGTTYVESIPWTAPAAGSGSIKIYGSLNAGGYQDVAATTLYQLATPVTITEGTATGIDELSGIVDGFTAYPTLMADKVTLSFDMKAAAAVTVTLVSMQGQTVKTFISGAPVGAGAFKGTYDVTGLPQGIYLVRCQIGNASVVSKVVKE